MGIAPTEKHIEDWIVDNLSSFNKQSYLNIQRIVARQPQIPTGIPDLVVYMPLALTVIEIKKGDIDIKAISQLCRYMADISHLHNLLYSEIRTPDDLHAHNRSIYSRGPTGRNPIHGVLVGNSIDKQTALHAHSAGIEYVIYDYNDGVYEFEHEPYGYYAGDLFQYDQDIVSGVKQLMRHLKMSDEQSLTRGMFTWREDYE